MDTEVSWPTERFSTVPPLEEARRLASEVIALGYEPHSSQCRPALIAEKLGIAVDFEPLLSASGRLIAHDSNMDGRSSQLQIVCDSRIFKEEPPDLHDYKKPDRLPLPDKKRFVELLFSFTVGHELGHIFFSDWVPFREPVQPVKHLLGKKSLFDVHHQEERFCDAFVESLLLPSADEEAIQWLDTIVMANIDILRDYK